MGSHYMEFQVGKMKKALKIVLMVVQQCECIDAIKLLKVTLKC